MILINATLILILLLLGIAAAVNISPTIAANFRLPGNEIAAPLIQTIRLEAGLSSRANGHFCSRIIQPAHFVSFCRPTSSAQVSRWRSLSGYRKQLHD
ncbi:MULTISPECIES: hypothetical protein [Bradyrhizobium]|uniref:hypothetical protein n=1 Tax=Bradyrhizobium elkanii TaxID=29448 RepID=UPI0012BBBB90|nr:hypothetical protein [Bradyrhizobium elkanii]